MRFTPLLRRPLLHLLGGVAGLLALLGPALAVPPATSATISISESTVESTADAASDAAALTSQFQTYGDTSGRWNGGDGAEPLRLPDGRVLWFFSDTFHGPVSADGTRRPFQSTFLRNSLVIQNGTSMSTVTRDGGTLVPAAHAGEWLWGADQMLVGDSVLKFYLRMASTGSGPWDFRTNGVELVSMPVATITDPTTYRKVALPAAASCGTGTCTLWGTAMVSDATWTYVYGTEKSGGSKYLRLARVPRGSFTSAWSYWTGSGWSSDAADSARMMDGVAEGFSVTYLGGRYVLVTQALEGGLGGDVVSYFASSPTGFDGTRRSVLYATPQTTTDHGNWTYLFRVVPHLSSGNSIVVAYSLNSQYKDGACTDQGYWTASIYRPRFVALTLPATATGGSDTQPTKAPPGAPWTMPSAAPSYCFDASLPASAPSGAIATALSGARIRLAWTAPAKAGKWSYDIRWRDASATTTWTDGALFTPDTTSWVLGSLVPRHRYEFQIRSAAWSGAKSAWSAIATATAYLAVPTNVQATRTSASSCAVTWSDGQPSVMWKVYERNRVTGAQREYGPFSVRSATLFGLNSGAGYEYRIRAVNSYGSSDPSAAAICPRP